VKGAEGANPKEIRAKLSGKRTVTFLNPGKPSLSDFCSERGTEGVNLSGQKTGGRCNNLDCPFSFYFGQKI